jgi:DegV family protein with EDD domain
VIRIVTDATCDLPDPVVERHGVDVVPIAVRFGDEVHTDLGPERFWTMLTSSETLPETVPPTAQDFGDVFDRIAEEGADGIVAICASSELSASYASAVIAAQQRLDRLPIRVVDTRLVSGALGLVVMAAVDLAQRADATPESVAEGARAAAERTNLFAVLDTIEFLRRGGRVGRVESALAGLLDVKPIITLSDGAVAAAGRVLGRVGAKRAILAKVSELAPRVVDLSVVHSGAELATDLVSEIRALLPGLEPVMVHLGPVVGTHTGPGAAGIAYRLD